MHLKALPCHTPCISLSRAMFVSMYLISAVSPIPHKCIAFQVSPFQSSRSLFILSQNYRQVQKYSCRLLDNGLGSCMYFPTHHLVSSDDRFSQYKYRRYYQDPFPIIVIKYDGPTVLMPFLDSVNIVLRSSLYYRSWVTHQHRQE